MIQFISFYLRAPVRAKPGSIPKMFFSWIDQSEQKIETNQTKRSENVALEMDRIKDKGNIGSLVP